MKEIEEILKLARSKDIICKGSAKPVWSEPGIMHIIQCKVCVIKAVKSVKQGWSIIKQ